MHTLCSFLTPTRWYKCLKGKVAVNKILTEAKAKKVEAWMIKNKEDDKTSFYFMLIKQVGNRRETKHIEGYFFLDCDKKFK